ncbi:ATP-binding protein [Streptomyces sp. NPDC006193]|uniref:ATP-binding protein n=1 Tax=Streptomyces sp. NPDC006193 TaxID=3155717 RepID=UPI0033B612E6
MKQSAAKSLGVAALGAAVAAVGAGAAHAAPAAPDAGRTLDTVTRTLPSEQLVEALPGSGPAKAPAPVAKRGGAVKPAGGKGASAARPLGKSVLAGSPTKPAARLLGGLPLRGLPTHGVPVNGIPVG